MGLTLNEVRLLEQELSTNGNRAARAANVLGYSLRDVLEYLSNKPNPRRRPNPRPELEKYVVASTKVGHVWEPSAELSKALADYAVGLVILCQWRDGNTIHQLAIPRVHRARL
jgi:hypothetical protein